MLESQDMQVDDAPPDEGSDAPRQTFNFAPSYHGLVYRGDYQQDADAGDEGVVRRDSDDKTSARYKLETMQWGLVPSWTKRNPDYGSLLKTINCRDDSLSHQGGLWGSIKGRKRCIVLAQGFYEWLHVGKLRTPHYVKRRDGQLMCLAGLWDCVTYDGECLLTQCKRLLFLPAHSLRPDSRTNHYTYTIITTDSNQQLKFLHDRMPVILNAGSDDMWKWLDTRSQTWTQDLQGILKPFTGELDCYPVSSEVGRVGNNSPTFVIPITSKENKSNIANYFKKPASKGEPATSDKPSRADVGDTNSSLHAGTKRPQPASTSQDEPAPKRGTVSSPPKPIQTTISATRNSPKGSGKAKTSTNKKITSFFTSE